MFIVSVTHDGVTEAVSSAEEHHDGTVVFPDDMVIPTCGKLSVKLENIETGETFYENVGYNLAEEPYTGSMDKVYTAKEIENLEHAKSAMRSAAQALADARRQIARENGEPELFHLTGAKMNETHTVHVSLVTDAATEVDGVSGEKRISASVGVNEMRISTSKTGFGRGTNNTAASLSHMVGGKGESASEITEGILNYMHNYKEINAQYEAKDTSGLSGSRLKPQGYVFKPMKLHLSSRFV